MSFLDQFRSSQGSAPPAGVSPLWGPQDAPQPVRMAPTPIQPSFGHPNSYVHPPTQDNFSQYQNPNPVLPAAPMLGFEARPVSEPQPNFVRHSMVHSPPNVVSTYPATYAPTNLLDSASETLMITKQIVLEKLGKAQVSELPFVRPKLDKLQQISQEFEQFVSIAERLANTFRNMKESQKSMGDFLKDASTREKEIVKDTLYELGSAFNVACHHGEEVFSCLQRLEDTARTFKKAAIEDALISAEKYETARISYDATRQKVAEMQIANADPNIMRASQQQLELKRNLFQQLGSDLATKMILLTEKRIQVLVARIQDYLVVNRKYYSACSQVFASIDTSAMSVENYNNYAFKGLVQQKTIEREFQMAQEHSQAQGVPMSQNRTTIDNFQAPQHTQLTPQPQYQSPEPQRSPQVPQGFKSQGQPIQQLGAPQTNSPLQPPQVQPSWNTSDPSSPPRAPAFGTSPPPASPQWAPQPQSHQTPSPVPVQAQWSPPQAQPQWSPQSAARPNFSASLQNQPPPETHFPELQPKPANVGVVLSRGNKPPPTDLDFLD